MTTYKKLRIAALCVMSVGILLVLFFPMPAFESTDYPASSLEDKAILTLSHAHNLGFKMKMLGLLGFFIGWSFFKSVRRIASRFLENNTELQSRFLGSSVGYPTNPDLSQTNQVRFYWQQTKKDELMRKTDIKRASDVIDYNLVSALKAAMPGQNKYQAQKSFSKPYDIGFQLGQVKDDSMVGHRAVLSFNFWPEIDNAEDAQLVQAVVLSDISKGKDSKLAIWLANNGYNQISYFSDPSWNFPTAMIFRHQATAEDKALAFSKQDTVVKEDSVWTHLKVDVPTMTIYPFLSKDTQNYPLTLKQVSGMIVGGVPGGGKSVFLELIALTLGTRPYVHLSIIDGKGQGDWDRFKYIADDYVEYHEDADGKGNYGEILNVLTRIDNKIKKRADRFKAENEASGFTKGTNFWHGTPTAENPYYLIIIDECQMIFDTKNINFADKEERTTANKIEALCEKFVRLYRSAGATAIFATQKPTVDSIPTQIRDNATMKIAFRLVKSSAVDATLGELPMSVKDTQGRTIENPVDPLKIPNSAKGMAVIENEAGNFEFVKTWYIPDKISMPIILNSDKAKAYQKKSANPSPMPTIKTEDNKIEKDTRSAMEIINDTLKKEGKFKKPKPLITGVTPDKKEEIPKNPFANLSDDDLKF